MPSDQTDGDGSWSRFWNTALEQQLQHVTPKHPGSKIVINENLNCNVLADSSDLSKQTLMIFFKCLVDVKSYTLARTGGLVQPPLRFFADSEKTAARSAAGFWGTLWGKPCATFGKKNWPGQVRSRSYDVIRGTTSGNFTDKSVFYRTLTWHHWCKW